MQPALLTADVLLMIEFNHDGGNAQKCRGLARPGPESGDCTGHDAVLFAVFLALSTSALRYSDPRCTVTTDIMRHSLLGSEHHHGRRCATTKTHKQNNGISARRPRLTGQVEQRMDLCDNNNGV